MVRTESVSHEKSFRACFPHVLLGPEPLDVATQRLRSRPAKRHNTDRMVVKTVPDDASIAELKKQAAECEQKATKERETRRHPAERKSGAVPRVDRRAQNWEMDVMNTPRENASPTFESSECTAVDEKNYPR